MLGHQASLNKFKKFEIIQSIFSDHSRIKLTLIMLCGPTSNIWKLNNILLNNQWVKEEIFGLNENESKIYGL